MKSVSTLMVEDNSADADLLSEELEALCETHFAIERVQTLAGARELMGRRHFDLILLDLSLPDSLGLDTLAAIRASDSLTPVIVLTGLDDQEAALFAARLKANDYLVKGNYSAETLSDSIQRALAQVRGRDNKLCQDLLELVVEHKFAQGGKGGAPFEQERMPRRAMEKERALLAAAVSSADDPVIVTDRRSTILYVNPAFSRVTGYSQQEALGNNPSMLKSGAHDAGFFAQIYRALHDHGTWNGQLMNRRKNGEFSCMDATITCMRDEHGEIENYVMVSRDITDFTEMQRQLNQSMRLNAIGQLAGGIAHDFNNVLQVILSYGSFLAEETRGSELKYINSYAMGICDAARRAANLTRQLLAFGRKQTLRTIVLDLNDLVESAAHLLERLIGEDVILSLCLDRALPHINVDPTQIEQIVMNLCVNARDAMPLGGEIRIATYPVDLDIDFCQSRAWASEGSFVCMEVSDTGTGMAPDVLDRIFEPFFTTKEEGKGSGMGLASVYGIVKQQKGLIHCTSEPGSGTSFFIYFPVAAEGERLPAAGAEPLEAVPEPADARILVAEDDALVALLARTLLESAGFSVTIARDGQSAFEELLASPEPYALVLSDVIMPRTGGMELLDLVMDAPEIDPKPRFLLCSGYSAGLVAWRKETHSSFEFLQKPYAPAELLMTVRKLLNTK